MPLGKGWSSGISVALATGDLQQGEATVRIQLSEDLSVFKV